MKTRVRTYSERNNTKDQDTSKSFQLKKWNIVNDSKNSIKIISIIFLYISIALLWEDFNYIIYIIPVWILLILLCKSIKGVFYSWIREIYQYESIKENQNIIWDSNFDNHHNYKKHTWLQKQYKKFFYTKLTGIIILLLSCVFLFILMWSLLAAITVTLWLFTVMLFYMSLVLRFPIKNIYTISLFSKRFYEEETGDIIFY